MSYKLLFICTGNICRSPIAEGLAPSIGTQYDHIIEAQSAGTLGLINRPADPKSIEVVKELKLDISEHRSQEITDELISWADYILVMERKHAAHVRKHFPAASDKVLELSSFGSLAEIADPIGRWKFTFRKIRKQIEKCLHSFLRQLPKR
jgi:protein arginine phosphatase